MYRRGCAGGKMWRRQKHEWIVLDTGESNKHICNFKCHKVAYLLAAAVYVGFQSRHPDEETVNEVHRELQENNIDVSHLVQWTADHCDQTESSRAGESPAANQTLSWISATVEEILHTEQEIFSYNTNSTNKI